MASVFLKMVDIYNAEYFKVKQCIERLAPKSEGLDGGLVFTNH